MSSPAISTTSRYDYLIVGAGINGLLLARNLAAEGARIALIDKGPVGKEASWAGGGIVSPLYPWRYPAPITALASWAQDYYPQLAEELAAETGIDVEFSCSGLLMLDARDREEAVRWAAQHDRKLQELGVQEIYQQEPALAPGFTDGLWMPQIANVRNPRLCQALAVSLTANKAVDLIPGMEWLGVASPDGRAAGKVRELESGRESMINASGVILCAGAWTGTLATQLGILIDVHPVKGQMLLYKFAQAPVRSIVLTDGRYLIPRRDGHVLAGSTLEYVGFDKCPTTAAADSLAESATGLLPQLAGIQPVKQWAGLRPASADGIPFIGPVPGWDNLFVNAGQFRNGLVLAPASARLLADILLCRTPIVDPTPYSPARQSCTPDQGQVKRD